MDYHELAQQMVELHTLLYLMPVMRKISVLDKGTFLALDYLMEQHKDVHPKELSQKMAVSTARVAALLKHMEREGLVVRRADPHDNRQVLVSLTPQGAQRIKNKKAEVVQIMAQALEELEPEEAEAYLRIQMKILQKLMLRA